MWEKIKKVVLYGNTEKKNFQVVQEEINESNRRCLIVYNMIVAVGMFCMVVMTFFRDNLASNRMPYLACAVTGVILGVIASKSSRKQGLLINICVYVFVAILMGFGIVMGTILNTEFVSVSFPILMFAVPLLFTDRPLRMGMAQVISLFCYIGLALQNQSDYIFGENMVSIIPYGIVSIILSGFMMCIKVRRHVLEYENRFLSESDQLTGMMNRRSFEQHMDLLRKNGRSPLDLTICAFDVNGLKKVNDTLGHHAGDELIRGAADCIEGAFGSYGRCYRTGGDEFMAILDGSHPTDEELRDSLNSRCSCFKGTYVSGLSISIGMVTGTAEDSLDALVMKADQEMYADKSRYYRQAGFDRRRR